MIFRLHRLSSEPMIFDPIDFHRGVNLIVGEKSDVQAGPQGRKVNGVGKSVCVDFLHFALCRSFSETRIAKIPVDVLPADLVVALDLTVGRERLQIRRRVADHNQPTIVRTDGNATTFATLADANEFLAALLFEGNERASGLSFRQLLSLLMRDERSGFKSIVNPYDVTRKVMDDITPHLCLLGIELAPYRTLVSTIDLLDKQKKLLAELKATLTNRGELNLADIPARLNEERQATRKIDEALRTLRADPAFEQVEQDLVGLETNLEKLRLERRSLNFQIDQIRAIPLPERIDADDIKIVYERIKSGLGELVEKSLEQAKEFKSEIERFQQSLREVELSGLETRRREVGNRIRELSDKHAELTRQIDRRGLLSEFTNGLEVATRRTDEYHRLQSQYTHYQEKLREVDSIDTDRANQIHAVQQLLLEHKDAEQSINDTLVGIHQLIQQSSLASFQFELSTSPTKKRPLSFSLRIQDDGSESIDQVRVFLYDFALLTDLLAKSNHPGFLLHDNILDVDQDTFVRCLNFLNELEQSDDDFQYILSLNRDRLENDETRSLLKLDIDKSRVARFTKSSQFLKRHYQEK